MEVQRRSVPLRSFIAGHAFRESSCGSLTPLSMESGACRKDSVFRVHGASGMRPG